VVGFGVYRWWDKIAPAGRSQQVSINPQEIKKTLDAAKPSPDKAAADVANKLLAGDKACLARGRLQADPAGHRRQRLRQTDEGRQAHRSVSHQHLAGLGSDHCRQ
jgi:hypothetical protein